MKLLLSTIVAALSLTAAQVQAEDFNPSKFLADKCSSCHGDVVYSRPDHRMQNLKQLEGQVRRCDANVGTGLFDEDIHSVVKHLNDTYYKF